jgi:3-oxoacyl-ACP reductase-like protein
MKKTIAAFAALIACATAPAAEAQATPATPSAALSACLVRSTTAADHTLLAQWIFVTMSRHPSVSQMTSLTDAQSVAINRQIGGLVNRLLTESCANETRAAVREGGPAALQSSFETLGRTAMTTLMGHPDVSAGLAGFAGYLDQEKLAAILVDVRK